MMSSRRRRHCRSGPEPALPWSARPIERGTPYTIDDQSLGGGINERRLLDLRGCGDSNGVWAPDLSYVENWSLVRDMVIVAATVKAVVLGTGAY